MMARETSMRVESGCQTAALATDEASLTAAIRRGDEAAYAEFVRRYYGRMLAVARRLLRCEEDAADAVQDAFVSLLRSVGNFQGQSSLSTWLHRIVVNAALMKLRSKKARPGTSIDDLLPQFIEDGHHAGTIGDWTDGEGALERMHSAEVKAMVRECIDLLPEDYRTILLLRDVEGIDTEETAVILGTTNGNVKTRLHRARQALQTLLQNRLSTHTE